MKHEQKLLLPGVIKVPRQFVADFAYVAAMEKWDAAGAQEMRSWVRNNAQAMDFIATLAHAYRNWYAPGAANNFVRVYTWLAQVGLEPITIYSRGNHEAAAKKFSHDDRVADLADPRRGDGKSGNRAARRF